MQTKLPVTVLLLVACICVSGVAASASVQTGADVQSGVASDERAEATKTAPASDQIATLQGEGGVQNETEPNDDPQSADQIQAGSAVVGRVGSASDLDVFALNLEAGETIRSNLTRLSGSGLLAVGLYGPGGFVSGTVAEPGQTTRYAEQANQSGQHFVIVASASQFGVEAPEAGGTGLYVLDVAARSTTLPGTVQEPTTREGTTAPQTTQPETTTPSDTTTPDGPATTTADGTTPGDANVESEPNDELAQANPLAVGESVRGEIPSPTDRDAYAVELDAGESVTVDLARSGGDGRLLFGAFHPNGDVIAAAGANPGETTTMTVEANQSGTYLLPVIPDPQDPGTGQYQLSVEPSQVGGPFGQRAETESNDDLGSATPIRTAEPVDGRIGSPSDVDWFSFEATEGDLVVVQVRASPDAALTYGLYRADGAVLTEDDTTADGDVQIQGIAESTGSHYVRVGSADGTGAYTLLVRTPGAEATLATPATTGQESATASPALD